MFRTLTAAALIMTLVSPLAAKDFSYAAIAKRYGASQLSQAELAAAKMNGECLVGLKEINFRSSEQFDPVAEWTNYRSLSLLEQFPPCTVLVMMEVARKDLLNEINGNGDSGKK